jgi:HSP20 family protein
MLRWKYDFSASLTPGRPDSSDADMSRLLQKFMGAKNPFHSFSEGAWRPPTDVYETDGEFVVVIEVPGADKKSISLEVRPDKLVVRGRREHDRGACQVSYHQVEIKFGSFEAQLRLPRGLETGEAQARYSDGFLTVAVPKRVGGPTTIDIDSGE